MNVQISPQWPIIRAEFAHTINGVDGRMLGATVGGRNYRPGTFTSQTWGASRPAGPHERLSVSIRFDDECRNGHNTFAITGDLRDTRYKGDRGFISGGCLHDDIARVFPELAHLIPWHLTSADGPMHYASNAVFLAGDRDCWGLRAGESRQIRNGRTGELCWTRKHVSAAYADGPRRPTEGVLVGWEPMMRVGEGKARELDAARRLAVWPDATDAELCAEPDDLRAALAARLPALLARFRADVEACGFMWAPPAADHGS